MDKGDNPKARMRKHIQNKKKYKGKPGTHTLPPKVKSGSALDSNWDRYEPEEVKQELNSSTDFSVLANTPITRGSHFQFKSDKDIIEGINIESDKTAELFKLDLIMLDKSLSTIAFYERSGIGENYFTENQRRIMAATARKNIEDYSSYLTSNHSTNNTPILIFNNESESSSNEDDNLAKNSSLDKEIVINEPVQNNVEPPMTAPVVVANDLEQWLDAILDD